MSSNIIVPLPKKSVAPSEKFEKASGYLDDIEEPVVENAKKYHFQGQSARSNG